MAEAGEMRVDGGDAEFEYRVVAGREESRGKHW
jgi:hypothetical protein